jgi:hypothetical protein
MPEASPASAPRAYHQLFEMGKYEVTQAQWEAVMGENPSYFCGADRPVEQVSFDEVRDFCGVSTCCARCSVVPFGYQALYPPYGQPIARARIHLLRRSRRRTRYTVLEGYGAL